MLSSLKHYACFQCDAFRSQLYEGYRSFIERPKEMDRSQDTNKMDQAEIAARNTSVSD